MTTYVQIDADSLRTLLSLAERRWAEEKPTWGKDRDYSHSVKDALGDANDVLRRAGMRP